LFIAILAVQVHRAAYRGQRAVPAPQFAIDQVFALLDLSVEAVFFRDALTEGNRLPRMFAVVMSLPRIDVRMQIQKSVQVIRLNTREFKPANVTRMSRKAEQSRNAHTSLWSCRRLRS
jgi:hypothetical protein